jgi:hypothetical protein
MAECSEKGPRASSVYCRVTPRPQTRRRAQPKVEAQRLQRPPTGRAPEP